MDTDNYKINSRKSLEKNHTCTRAQNPQVNSHKQVFVEGMHDISKNKEIKYTLFIQCPNLKRKLLKTLQFKVFKLKPSMFKVRKGKPSKKRNTDYITILCKLIKLLLTVL